MYLRISLALLLSAPLLSFASAPSTPSRILAPSDEPDLVANIAKDYSNRVLLIRHGEKVKDGKVGLSKMGKKRAQCLRRKLGRSSEHNIGMIMAEAYNPSGTRARPYLTVKPLAKDLGLKVHVGCDRDDAACVRKAVKKFTKHSTKDVLICWKHSVLADLAHALGAEAKTPYPDDRFDIMWIMENQKIIDKRSEQCEGIDDGRNPNGDLDLEVEDSADDEGIFYTGGPEDEDDEEEAELYGESGQLKFAE